MCIGLHVKYRLLLSDFNGTRILWTDVFHTHTHTHTHTQIPNFMKLRPAGTELFSADGQTEVPNLISIHALHNFEKSA